MLLGTFTDFKEITPEMTSWRFVPLGHYITPEWYNMWIDFQNFGPLSTALNPPYPSYLNNFVAGVTAGSNSLITANYGSSIAVKMGDVNFNVSDYACEQFTSTEDRDLTFAASGIESKNGISAGAVVSIKVKALDDATLASWQAGLQFNNEDIDIKGVTSPSFPQFDKDAYSVIGNDLKMVWFDDRAQTSRLSIGATYFEITFKTKREIFPNETLFTWEANTLPTRFYGASGEELPLRFDAEIASTGPSA
jgi:hypothetical protein